MPNVIKGLFYIKENVVHIFFFSSMVSVMSINVCTCSVVECFSLNPNWYVGKMFLLSIVIFSLFNSNVSDSFETTSSNDIGLCEVTSFGGFLVWGSSSLQQFSTLAACVLI
jgi:hypothetical protein